MKKNFDNEIFKMDVVFCTDGVIFSLHTSHRATLERSFSPRIWERF
jgi:hypothetical protein